MSELATTDQNMPPGRPEQIALAHGTSEAAREARSSAKEERLLPGQSFPLGATVYPDGVNFSVFSKRSTQVELLLFDHVDDPQPARAIPLDPQTHRTYHYWHAFIPGLTAGTIYAYRVAGPFEPKAGMRFDADKVLLDPYGRAVVLPAAYSRQALRSPGSTAATAMKSVVADTHLYDWEGDVPPRQPFAKTVLYELHVAGFTRHPSSGVAPEKRGTYAGLIEKIPYLQHLGITTIELLPVFQFDEQDSPPSLVNYWGYSPASFFAPHASYSSRRDPLGPLDEFRDMVKALHRAGIEVILDVVYNHTAEGNHGGPTFCFRGLANDVYYTLETDKSYYANYTGTGNTFNANQPIVRRMIVDSLRYWVEVMHVDGFRFDLASILSRDESGRPMENPPILWDIESDPVLANVKVIAEAWDAAGLYQVGSFIGDSWKEWNGRFRDDIRSFLRGDCGVVAHLPQRLLGSPDIYGHQEREPEQSINFVTCHDGFTLNDLVSYNHKHNEANQEANRDGCDQNLGWNCGVEGPTTNADVEQLRNRQIKNHLALTLISLGTPMLLMGDEVRRTQRGNNNAYCQDNDLSWFDWALLDRYPDIHRFATCLIHQRAARDMSRGERYTSLNEILRRTRVQCHGIKLGQPDWGYESHSLAMTAWGVDFVFHLMVNAYWDALEFELPPPSAGLHDSWRRWVDTYLPSPDDICSWDDAPAVQGSTYQVQPRSVVFLISRPVELTGSSP